MDTREKLWADCEDLIHRIQERFFSGRNETALRDQFAELLDRQKAITEREWITKITVRPKLVTMKDDNTFEIETYDMRIEPSEASRQIAELQAKVDELTAERDTLLEQIQEYAEEAANFEQSLADVEKTHMRLPVDADGVPIKPGDVMEGVDKFDTLHNVTGKVVEISFNVTDTEESVTSIAVKEWSKDGKSWHMAYLDPFFSVYRHVKPETVEGIIAEAMSFACEPESPYSKNSKYVKQYAERIRKAVER